MQIYKNKFHQYLVISHYKRHNTDTLKTELKKFIDAIKKAKLVDTLKAEGPFTVFAPINAAFEVKRMSWIT